MKIVVAIDSLKGSMSSMEAGEAVKEGILQAISDAQVVIKPLADGGEGTVDALILGMKGKEHTAVVSGPLGSAVKARYGIVNGNTAVMEMAEASGITLVPQAEQNPLKSDTRGVGELIKDAAEKGCREFIIGIGGSATNDGGMGMLHALGYRFLDKDKQEVDPQPENLKMVEAVDAHGVLSVLSQCRFRIACDVNNPLCGSHGASHIFGPQKGADTAMVLQLDEALAHFAEVTCRHTKKDVSKEPGTGAAGGLGFGFLAYLNGILEPGIDIIMDTVGLEDALKDADIAVTGEGRLDAQTMMGKAPAGVARLAKKYGCTVIALAGCAAKDAVECNRHGIDAYFPILQNACTMEEAMEKETARENMKSTARQVFGLVGSCINDMQG